MYICNKDITRKTSVEDDNIYIYIYIYIIIYVAIRKKISVLDFLAI